MVIICVLLVLLGGFCLSFQSPTNTALSTYVGNFQSACISFGGGVIALGILVITLGQGDLSLITEVAPWQLLGGVYGAYMILIITFTTPIMGIAMTLTLSMFGQIVIGMVIDYFGLLGTEAQILSPLRVVGCVAVALGIYIVYRGRKKQHDQPEATMGKRIAIGTLMFIGGVGGAIQSPTNAALAAHVGKLEASFISFLTGFLVLFIFTLIINRGKFRKMCGIGIKPWMLTGGLYGAAVVFFNIVATPYIGVTIVVSAAMFATLAGGLIIDRFGLLRAQVLRGNGLRTIGVVVIAIGVLIVTIAKL